MPIYGEKIIHEAGSILDLAMIAVSGRGGDRRLQSFTEIIGGNARNVSPGAYTSPSI